MNWSIASCHQLRPQGFSIRNLTETVVNLSQISRKIPGRTSCSTAVLSPTFTTKPHTPPQTRLLKKNK